MFVLLPGYSAFARSSKGSWRVFSGARLARCPKSDQVGRLFAHRYIDCSFHCAGFIAPNHLVFIEPGFFMLSEYRDEHLTIPVSVVFLRSFGMRGPKC